MNPIINSCEPQKNNLEDQCGSYFVNLTENRYSFDGRDIGRMFLNSSCTYRVMTTCGYPSVQVYFKLRLYDTDFDIAWATKDDVGLEDDLDKWDQGLKTEWNGSFQTVAD